MNDLPVLSDETTIATITIRTKTVGESTVSIISDSSNTVCRDGVITIEEDVNLKPTLYAETASGAVGTTVTVPICIKNNPGMSGYRIKVKYDSTALDPEEIINGNNFTGAYSNIGIKTGEFSVIWINLSGRNVNANGTVFEVSFRILKEGTHEVELSYSKEDTFDESDNELDIVCKNFFIYTDVLIYAVKGSGTVVDHEFKTVYGLSSGLSDLFGNVEVADGYSFDVVKDTECIGTNSEIIIRQNEKTIDKYYVVLFGDVDGDGWYDGRDSFIVNCITNGMLTREQVGEAKWMAADCNHDGEINSSDVLLLEQAGLLLENVDQTASQDELMQSDSYMEYLDLIDQNPNDGEITEIPVEEPAKPESKMQAVLNKIIAFIKMIIDFISSLAVKQAL